jgi:hypothetical protein
VEPRTHARMYTCEHAAARARCKLSAPAGEWKIYFFQVVVPQRLAARGKTGRIFCKSLQINDLARCSILRHFGLGRGRLVFFARQKTGRQSGFAVLTVALNTTYCIGVSDVYCCCSVMR